MLRERDGRQHSWLSDHEGRLRAAATTSGTHQARQSGTAEWRALRAESGRQNGASFSIMTRHSKLDRWLNRCCRDADSESLRAPSPGLRVNEG